MHGRGSQASAPASDAAGRGRDAADRASVPRRATWRFPNRVDAAEIGADAAQIGPTQSISAVSAETAESGRNSKKKIYLLCLILRMMIFVFDCLVNYLLFCFSFKLMICILISKHHGMF